MKKIVGEDLFNINISNMELTVVLCHISDEGRYEADKQRILISDKFSEQRRRRTLLHEIGHVFCDLRNRHFPQLVASCQDGDVIEESMVDFFANGIFEVLDSNENLRDYLFKKGRK